MQRFFFIHILALMAVMVFFYDGAFAEKPYNRLVHEKSPYLLQHKDNPIHWYAWGEEALQASRDQNKPIFLSIG